MRTVETDEALVEHLDIVIDESIHICPISESDLDMYDRHGLETLHDILYDDGHEFKATNCDSVENPYEHMYGLVNAELDKRGYEYV